MIVHFWWVLKICSYPFPIPIPPITNPIPNPNPIPNTNFYVLTGVNISMRGISQNSEIYISVMKCSTFLRQRLVNKQAIFNYDFRLCHAACAHEHRGYCIFPSPCAVTLYAALQDSTFWPNGLPHERAYLYFAIRSYNPFMGHLTICGGSFNHLWVI